ncbi:DNA repair protein RecO [Candidatus Bipolaricaulota bacterium]|nr:DNA repair protein RecO [Candidatus Bipolaricaulota bacterium]
MGIERGEAFVLRVRDFAESDLIVTLFTTEWGKRTAIAKGARRFKSRLGGVFDLLNHVEVVFYAKAQLDLISQGALISGYPRLKGSIDTVLAALSVGKLLDRLLPAHQREQAPYMIFEQLLDLLEERVPQWEQTNLAAMLKIVSVLGHRPQFTACVHCGSTRGPFRFVPTRGGIVCTKCEGEGINLSRGLALSLNALIDRPLPRAGIVRMKKEDLSLAHELVDLYLRELAGTTSRTT